MRRSRLNRSHDSKIQAHGALADIHEQANLLVMVVIRTMTGFFPQYHLPLLMPATRHVLLPTEAKKLFTPIAHLERSPGCQHRQQQKNQYRHHFQESGHYSDLYFT